MKTPIEKEAYLETITREFYRVAYLGDEKAGWLSFSDMAKKQSMKCMRAALLALAEVELPAEAIDAALMSISPEEIKFVPVADVDKAEVYFKAILKALAADGQ